MYKRFFILLQTGKVNGLRFVRYLMSPINEIDRCRILCLVFRTLKLLKLSVKFLIRKDTTETNNIFVLI